MIWSSVTYDTFQCDCVVVYKQIVGWLYMKPAFNIVILISKIQENKELIKLMDLISFDFVVALPTSCYPFV